MIVCVSTDEFNAVKGKKAAFTYEKRADLLRSIRYVDEVVPEENWGQKIEDVKRYDADVFVMGDDWKGKFDELKEFCEVVYLDRTPDISSTALRGLLASDEN